MSEDASAVEKAVTESEEPSYSLVEIEPGVAVLFADEVPTDLEFAPFAMMNERSRLALTDKLAATSGLANLAAQGANGFVNAQGLVRLSPDTVKLLKTFQPMTSGGWNLGPIVDDGGKIVAQARFAPVAGVKSLAMLQALGPAAALLAIQLQLASISRRVDENIELTREVLKAIHEDQWMTLLGLHETTLRAVREAQAVGAVNDHVFAAIATKEADLRKQRHLFVSFVRRHVQALDTDRGGRRTYIQKNAEQMIADAHGMLMAEGSWYRAQVLRAGHILRDEANAVENERLLAELTEETKRDHDEAMAEAANLLEELERQCRVMAELPGEFALPFTTKRRDIAQTTQMAAALSAQVAELRNRQQSSPAAVEPAITVFKEGAPDDVTRILQWLLPAGSTTLALADVNVEKLISENAYLAVTREAVYLSSHGAIRKQGVIEREFPLADIRYLRFRERPKQSPTLDIITVDENIRLSFDGWSSTGQNLEDARRLGNLLSAAMNLPDEERREDPLLVAEPALEAILA